MYSLAAPPERCWKPASVVRTVISSKTAGAFGSMIPAVRRDVLFRAALPGAPPIPCLGDLPSWSGLDWIGAIGDERASTPLAQNSFAGIVAIAASNEI